MKLSNSNVYTTCNETMQHKCASTFFFKIAKRISVKVSNQVCTLFEIMKILSALN